MHTVRLICWLIAAIAFALVTVGVDGGRVNLLGAGLLAFVLPFLIDTIND